MSSRLAALALLFGGHAIAATVYPVETTEPLHNPNMGWAIVEYSHSPDLGTSWAPEEGAVPYPWYDNVQVLYTWAGIEKSPGEYDWSAVDRIVDYWSAQGKTVHLIGSTEWYFNADDFIGCPEWLYGLGIAKWGGRDYPHGQFPDYSNPIYLKHLRQFTQAMADHFCDDPRIGMIAIRAYGAYGEWHSGTPYRTVEERERALKAVFHAWYDAIAGRNLTTVSVSYEWLFPELTGTPGVLPRGTSIYDEYPPTYRDYLERSIFDYVFELPGVCAKRDGVGGAVFIEYDGRLLANVFEQWRRPIFTEPFGGYGAYTGPSPVGFPNTRKGDDFLENAVDEALSYRPNYLTMHWGRDFHRKRPDLVRKAQMLLGYRFYLARADHPDRVVPGGTLSIRQTWENRAMGRCPELYRLAAYLMRGEDVIWSGVDEDFDPRCFVAGESHEIRSDFTLPEDLTPGEYQLGIGLVDAARQPALDLAMEGADDEKRYALGTVSVARGDAVPPSAIWGELNAPLAPDHITSDTPLVVGDVALPANTTYLVSFRYEVTGNPANDLNTDDPGYFACYAEGDDGVRIGETRWYDRAGQPPARKTVLIALRERTDYRLVWEAAGGGSMSVDDVGVEELDAARVRRLAADTDWPAAVARDLVVHGNATAFDRRRPPCPLPVVTASRDRSEVRLPDDWYDFLETNAENVRLEPNTSYTVWFTCSIRPQIWQGDYAYVAVRVGERGTGPDRAFFMWTQRYTSNPVRRAYTFRTGPEEGYRLVWGLKNGGQCEISQIVVVQL